MDKRYQVFVSSTFDDLHEERQEVLRALLELDCIPSGMELFPAADEDAWTLIKRVIDDSDYYIVISAGRYGSLHPESGVGYTEMEYDYAVETGKPVLAFLHADPRSLPEKKIELNEMLREKLESFRDKMRRKVVKEWINEKDLGSIVSRGISQAIKYHGGVGWIRANRPRPQDELEISKLRLRVTELERDILKTDVIDFDKLLLQREKRVRLDVKIVDSKKKVQEEIDEVEFIIKICQLAKEEKRLYNLIWDTVRYFINKPAPTKLSMDAYRLNLVRDRVLELVELGLLEAKIRKFMVKGQKHPEIVKCIRLRPSAENWLSRNDLLD